ncbi:Zinc finger C-x8-C-x5-C-x3-H type family protein [Cryptosporidium felis]|nr:Zinc finger C-x8-C-x5-C-x3-H type family protein [Cryptosporidium felis]
MFEECINTCMVEDQIHGHEDSEKKHYMLSIYELYVFRTIVCNSHLHGKCENSDSCPFSHCLTWQRRNPNDHYYSPKLCPEICFVKNNEKMNLIRRCKKGKLCTFAHSKEEQLYHPLMYKTKGCSLYPNCNRYYCPFSHGVEQIRTPEKVRKSMEQIIKGDFGGILKDPYYLLSNILKNKTSSIRSARKSNSSKPQMENTNRKKETSLKSKYSNSVVEPEVVNHSDLKIRNISSIWDSMDSWNFNANLNFHPTYMDMISLGDTQEHFANNVSLPSSSMNDCLAGCRLETEYDQIWKEISSECSNKKEEVNSASKVN